MPSRVLLKEGREGRREGGKEGGREGGREERKEEGRKRILKRCYGSSNFHPVCDLHVHVHVSLQVC